MIGATSLANVTPAIFSAPRLKRNAKKNASASAAAIRINLKAPFITNLQDKGENYGSAPRATKNKPSPSRIMIKTRPAPLTVPIIKAGTNAVPAKIPQKPFGRDDHMPAGHAGAPHADARAIDARLALQI